MFKLFITLALASLACAAAHAVNYEERNGFLVIEAEDYAHQAKSDVRRWFRIDKDNATHNYADADEAHYEGASGGAYLEILPDTRTNHSEKLIHNVNFIDKPGVMAILSYPVYINNPGRYYVWARAFSTGPEDNGFHIGLNGNWPASSQRLQFCKNKFQWTWSSAQRRPENHCGEPLTNWIDIDKPGVHTLMISMREDGIELDKLILAQDKSFKPTGLGPDITVTTPSALPEKSAFFDIKNYQLILHANENFTFEKPVYIDKKRAAMAINAVHDDARNVFLGGSTEYTKKGGNTFNLTLVTLTEIDGESEYRVKLNKKVIGKFKNPETETDYAEAYFEMKNIKIKQGDKITVESKAVTNGKIPENDETAYARGRWRGLVLEPVRK